MDSLSRLIANILAVLLIGATPLLAQVQVAIQHPTSEEWLAQRRTYYREDPLSDDILLRGLSRRLAKFIELGPKELEIERYFQTGLFLTGRFHDRLSLTPTAKERQWRLLMSDVIIRGEVSAVRDEAENCGYGTEVTIEVTKCFKGDSTKTVTVHLISGKRPHGKIVVVVHEARFDVGERIIALLTTVPFQMHQEVLRHPCPDQTDLFYITNTGGAYFELMTVAKIDKASLTWFDREMSLPAVEEEIQEDLRVDVSDW